MTMDPRIQYATTSDGVSIAFWTIGHGPPLIHTRQNLVAPHFPLSASPERLRWFELLSEKRTIIRYDPRGAGLSQHDVPDMSLSALELDIDAIARELSLARFSLLASSGLGPVGVAYAAHHPERLTGMILWDATAGHLPFFVIVQQMDQLLEEDWEEYIRAIVRLAQVGPPRDAGAFAAALMESFTPMEFKRLLETMRSLDASSVVSEVTTPTLVVVPGTPRRAQAEALRATAARITGARLMILPNATSAPWQGDIDEAARVVDEFLSTCETQAGDLPAPDVSLTPRETEVLRLLAQGRSNRQIAEELVLSERTVARHVANIYERLNVHTRAAVTAFALKNRII